MFACVALNRQAHGYEIESSVIERLQAAADFIDAYSRADHSTPVVGDNDDGRFLPMAMHDLNKHRYLSGLIRHVGDPVHAIPCTVDMADELLWFLGSQSLDLSQSPPLGKSSAFPVSGIFVLRNNSDHVTVLAQPMGMNGRGGHSHNDAMSFDAVLRGVHLIADSGCHVYTSDYSSRNAYRGTAFHNTPQIEDEQINRFYAPDLLWLLREDAHPKCLHHSFQADCDDLYLTHDGYHRLEHPVQLKRQMTLHHAASQLMVQDEFESDRVHDVTVPFHFAPEVMIHDLDSNSATLTTPSSNFRIQWSSSANWHAEVQRHFIAPSLWDKGRNNALVAELQAGQRFFKHCDYA